MAGKSQVATRKIRLHENLDVIRKWWWEEGGLLEGWVVPAEPDMIAGVNTETRDVLLKVAQFDSCYFSNRTSYSLKECPHWRKKFFASNVKILQQLEDAHVNSLCNRKLGNC